MQSEYLIRKNERRRIKNQNRCSSAITLADQQRFYGKRYTHLK